MLAETQIFLFSWPYASLTYDTTEFNLM